VDSQFEAFRAGYGVAGNGASWPKARSEWARLSSVDRAEALLRLPRYLDHCQAQSRKVCHPTTYLSERRWEGFSVAPSSGLAPVAADLTEAQRAVAWARSTASRDGWVFVEEGSPGWAAWRDAFRHAGYAFPGAAMTLAPDGSGGWARRRGRSFPMATPPPAPP